MRYEILSRLKRRFYDIIPAPSALGSSRHKCHGSALGPWASGSAAHLAAAVQSPHTALSAAKTDGFRSPKQGLQP